VSRPAAPPLDLPAALRALADRVQDLDVAQVLGELEALRFRLWTATSPATFDVPAPDERPPLTVAAVAQRIGFSKDVVYDMLRRGELWNVGRGRAKRVAAAAVDTWLAGRDHWPARVHLRYRPPRESLGRSYAPRAARPDPEGARRRARRRADDCRAVGTGRQSRQSTRTDEPDAPGAAAWALRPRRRPPARPPEPEA
jgi:excisionase family DNA binding protein